MEERRYALLTLHRPSNVDAPERLHLILDQLAEVSETLPVVFPVHPRTRKTIDAMALSPSFKRQSDDGRLQLVDPLGYLDFLRLESQAALVISDSGGVQEETSFLGIPCLTVRPNTERPVTVAEGTNRLVDPERVSLRLEAERSLRECAGRPAPQIEYWDGRTAPRAIRALREYMNGW